MFLLQNLNEIEQANMDWTKKTLPNLLFKFELSNTHKTPKKLKSQVLK